jgi:predicted dehydrogenase
MAKGKIKVGIIGCGAISAAYLRRLPMFENIEVAACADLDAERAKARAAEFKVPRVCSVRALLADPEIGIVLNLTVPKAHAEVALAALEAGKSVYSEKPLAVRREDGRRLLDLAAEKGLRVGCAPDTFLGAGLQTCRKVIDDGLIGEPVAATAFMLCHGHESWHPSPEFYYEIGGGPMFDMGPYYLTALISLIGPIRRVTACTRVTFPERTITSEPKKGKVIRVETPTHIAGVMEFAGGAIGTIVTSFDVWGGKTPLIEIYGTQGSLSCPDPNAFGGEVLLRRPAEKGHPGRLMRTVQAVLLRRAGEKEWMPVPLSHAYSEDWRGIGVADMACGLQSGRRHRANGEMAYHVLDVMQSFLDSGAKGRHVTPASTCERPAALPTGLAEGKLDP